jgi:glycine oxidase
MKYDYFILGGGIAGSVLAFKLHAAGYRIKLYDFYNPSSSSRVAAGLLNPVTGRRFSLTWRASDVFAELKKTYVDMESLSGEKLLHPLKIVRLCNSLTEFNDWSSKAADARYKDFVDSGSQTALDQTKVDDKEGAIYLKQGGYLNTNKTLSFVSAYLGASFQQVSKKINHADIDLAGDTVTIDGESAHNLIMADGYLSYQNPFFSYLPFTPMKGEILDLIIPDFYQDRGFIRGGFLIPFGNSHYRAGATYDPINLDENTTDAGKENIIQRLDKYLKTDYSINKQYAGIRPAVKDRRPLLGTHPEIKNVHLFNGFGSKGSSLAPVLSDYFIDFLENNKALPPECDIQRYESLHSST